MEYKRIKRDDMTDIFSNAVAKAVIVQALEDIINVNIKGMKSKEAMRNKASAIRFLRSDLFQIYTRGSDSSFMIELLDEQWKQSHELVKQQVLKELKGDE